MNEEILKLAQECGIQINHRFGEIYTGNVQLEAFYRAAFNAGIEAAAKVCDSRHSACMEPEIREVAIEIRTLEIKP